MLCLWVTIGSLSSQPSNKDNLDRPALSMYQTQDRTLDAYYLIHARRCYLLFIGGIWSLGTCTAGEKWGWDVNRSFASGVAVGSSLTARDAVKFSNILCVPTLVLGIIETVINKTSGTLSL